MTREQIEIRLEETAAAATHSAAGHIAASMRRAVAARGGCTLALSGGSSAGPLLDALAGEDVPWHAVHLFQVDERIAPSADPARNTVELQRRLLARVDIPKENVHLMPVEQASLRAAAADYSRQLSALAGEPPVLDVVHLGLGADGHTASLVPDDPLLDEETVDVGVSREFQGHRRLTLTYRCLRGAREIVWLVTGAAKADALRRLVKGDVRIPAGRINHDHGVIYADRAAVDPGSSQEDPD